MHSIQTHTHPPTLPTTLTPGMHIHKHAHARTHPSHNKHMHACTQACARTHTHHHSTREQYHFTPLTHTTPTRMLQEVRTCLRMSELNPPTIKLAQVGSEDPCAFCVFDAEDSGAPLHACPKCKQRSLSTAALQYVVLLVTNNLRNNGFCVSTYLPIKIPNSCSTLAYWSAGLSAAAAGW